MPLCHAMRVIFAAAAITLVVASTGARTAAADAYAGGPPSLYGVAPRVSIELRDTHLALGGEARFTVATFGSNLRFDVRPSFDYYIYDGGSLLGLSGDGLFAYDLRSDAVEPYVGAGLSLLIASADRADTVTRIGLDLLAGLRFVPRRQLQPFAELRATVGDIDPLLLTGGVIFTF